MIFDRRQGRFCSQESRLCFDKNRHDLFCQLPALFDIASVFGSFRFRYDGFGIFVNLL